MLKLLIADDERVIRETISRIIPWENFDIELAGLELIKKISGTELNTQFIILSGYGEYEYAKKAMKNGVRHYILKPCNEQQILESIREVTADCCRRKQELIQKFCVLTRPIWISPPLPTICCMFTIWNTKT